MDTGKWAETEHNLPIEDKATARLAALFSKKVPDMIQLDLSIGTDIAEQSYSTEGLLSYTQAMASSSPEKVRSMLASLCAASCDHPILLDADLCLLARDRLFWDAKQEKWRFLLLLADDPVWRAYPDHEPDAIWSELFAAAMNANPGVKDMLMGIVNTMLKGEFSLERLLGAIRDAKIPAPASPSQPVIPGMAPPPAPPQAGYTPAPQPGADRGKPETTVLGGAPGGAHLSKPIRIPRVVRESTNESAYVDRPRFVIGSKPGSVDFLIRGTTYISRTHAAILSKGSDYYLVDLGSKNGVTYQGRRLAPNEERLISVGDSFVLANESFRLQW